MKNKQKFMHKKLFILSILVMLAVAGCTSQEEKPVVEDEPVNDVEDISDWQTYINEEYGFSFKHPRDWQVKRGGEGASTTLIRFVSEEDRVVHDPETLLTQLKFAALYFRIYYSFRDAPFMVTELKKDLSSAEEQGIIKDLYIHNEKEAEFKFFNTQMDQYEYVKYLILDNEIASFSYLEEHSESNAAWQIISDIHWFDFTFPHEADASISTWQAYNNEKYGISFKYPNQLEIGPAMHNFRLVQDYDLGVDVVFQDIKRENANGRLGVSDLIFFIGIADEPKENIVQRLNFVKNYRITKRVFDGVAFDEYSFCLGGSGADDAVDNARFLIAESGDKSIIIKQTNMNVNQQYDYWFNAILGTLKFTPILTKGGKDISNWQAYTNQEAGLEFKYPEDWQVKELSKKKFEIYPLSDLGASWTISIREVGLEDSQNLINARVAGLGDNFGDNKIVMSDIVKIDGKQFQKVTIAATVTNWKNTFLFLEHDNKLFEIFQDAGIETASFEDFYKSIKIVE